MEVLKLSDLKLTLCFFALCLKVRNCWLVFLSEEFVEKVLASISVIPFCLLLFMSCLRGDGWVFSEIFRIIFQIEFVLVAEFIWFTVLPVFLLGFLYDFALSCLKEFKLMVVGSLLNLCRATFHRLIAVLKSSLNQGVLCLFKGELFGIVSFAIEARVSVSTLLFASCNCFHLRSVLNSS